jgi:hypothetical protein
MTDTHEAVRTAAVATGLSAFAGIIGGPVLAAVVGFVAGLPLQLILAATLAAVTWISPITGVWLAIITVVAVIAFILGAIRKPPPGIYRLTGHTPVGQHITSLERQLAAARAREQALIAALTAAHQRNRPPAVAALTVRGEVTK